MTTEERTQALTQDLHFALQRISALESALGVIVMLTLRQLPPERQARFGDELAAMAATAEREGDMAAATLLTELHSAAAQTIGG